MTVLLRASDVRIRYGGIEVLHGVGLAVPGGALTAVCGPNGAGKSTLFTWCGGAPGTATTVAGALELQGRRAERWSAAQRASAGLRLVPSGVNVFPNLTVAENLAAVGEARTALKLFPELERLLPQKAATLSGGERQLLAVSGALSGRWRVLLIDEPAQGLAPALAARLYAALVDAATDGRAIVVAEPIRERALRYASFVWLLERGRMTFAGEPAELRSAQSA